MDPLYVSTPREAALFELPHEAGVSLWYELRGSSAAADKVVLLMGALATLRHVDELADRLAAGGAEVLTFDWRGIGRSTASARTRLRSQSSAELACDAQALLEHVWGSGSDDARVHVYGASMGGMVAQRLALLLVRCAAAKARPSKLRLRSLMLAVTAASYGLARFMPLGASFYRFMLPMALSADPGAMVASLLPKVFEKEHLDARHERTGERVGDLFLKRWTREYREWFAFGDLDACASQCTVAATHYFSATDAAELRAARIPTLVAVAPRDELIAPAAQRALATLLGADIYEGRGGHMGSAKDFADFVARIAAHVRDAA